MRRPQLTLLILMLLAAFWLAVSSLVGDSPTMDEQNHIARGITILRTGDARLSLEHPPLINSWSALPLLTIPDLRLPTDDTSWQQTDGWYRFAQLLLWEYNPQHVPQLIFLARIPIVLVWLLMACVGFQFATTLWHKKAGLLAATLLLFDPNIMAHARYSTTDLGGAATLMLAMFALWRLWQPPASPNLTMRNLAFAAIAMGMAFASKLSNLGFVPILGVVALLPLFGSRRWQPVLALRRLSLYLLAGVGSIGIVWAIFRFEWGVFDFVDARLSMLNGISGPMPTFWEGIERIAFTTSTGRVAFLLGEFSENGFPLYFPVAFLVKTPLVSLLLLVCGLLFVLNFRETRRQAFFLLIPALFYLGTTTRSGLNIGYRHLTPMLVLLYIAASGITPAQLRRDGRLTLRSFLVLFCAAGLLASNLIARPHYIGHFNGIVRSVDGWMALGDSNIDWGQDLLRLRGWMDDNGIERVKLSYFGTADPAAYLDYDPLPSFPVYHRELWDPGAVPFNTAEPEPGVYAISVANFHELHHNAPENKVVFEWFRNREPDLRIGSFNVYTIR